MNTLNEFVLTPSQSDDLIWRISVIDYALFLNQKPILGMFVACDEDGCVMEEPQNFNKYQSGFMPTLSPLWSECQQYQSALDRVIFEGFELMGKNETTTLVAMSGMTDPILWIGRDGNITSFGKDIKTISDLCGLVTIKQKQ